MVKEPLKLYARTEEAVRNIPCRRLTNRIMIPSAGHSPYHTFNEIRFAFSVMRKVLPNILFLSTVHSTFWLTSVWSVEDKTPVRTKLITRWKITLAAHMLENGGCVLTHASRATIWTGCLPEVCRFVTGCSGFSARGRCREQPRRRW